MDGEQARGPRRERARPSGHPVRLRGPCRPQVRSGALARLLHRRNFAIGAHLPRSPGTRRRQSTTRGGRTSATRTRRSASRQKGGARAASSSSTGVTSGDHTRDVSRTILRTPRSTTYCVRISRPRDDRTGPQNAEASNLRVLQMADAIKNRYDFVYFFDITDGNPNGDPDAGNLPRIDPETGQGLVTDVCLKRKIRNFVGLDPRRAAAVRDLRQGEGGPQPAARTGLLGAEGRPQEAHGQGQGQGRGGPPR